MLVLLEFMWVLTPHEVNFLTAAPDFDKPVLKRRAAIAKVFYVLPFHLLQQRIQKHLNVGCGKYENYLFTHLEFVFRLKKPKVML